MHPARTRVLGPAGSPGPMLGAMLRTPLLLLTLLLAPLAAAELVRDDLIGPWRLAADQLTDAQQAAAERAQAVEGFGLVLTNRIGRALWSDGTMIAGMWRLEDATETTGTIVIQSKGGSEHRLGFSLEDGVLTVTDSPGKLPLKRP